MSYVVITLFEAVANYLRNEEKIKRVVDTHKFFYFVFQFQIVQYTI